jgi:hypothetical protein
MQIVRPMFVLLLALTMLLSAATSVFACSGFVDCLFGFTDRVEIRQREMTERAQEETQQAQLNAQRDTEIARINADADAQLRQQEAQIELQRQQGLLSAEQARQQAENFRAVVAQNAAIQIQQITANYGLMAESLAHQADIAQAGIQESGMTERERVKWSGTLNIVAFIVVGLIVVVILRSRERQSAQPTIYVLPGEQHKRLPQSPNQIETMWRDVTALVKKDK